MRIRGRSERDHQGTHLDHSQSGVSSPKESQVRWRGSPTDEHVRGLGTDHTCLRSGVEDEDQRAVGAEYKSSVSREGAPQDRVATLPSRLEDDGRPPLKCQPDGGGVGA